MKRSEAETPTDSAETFIFLADSAGCRRQKSQHKGVLFDLSVTKRSGSLSRSSCEWEIMFVSNGLSYCAA